MVVNAFLANTLCNDDVQGHIEAFVCQLLLDSMQKLSEQFVVTLDRGRVFTWCLGFDLRGQSVKPLPRFLGVEARFTVSNYESRRSEVLDPRLVNATDERLRGLVREYSRDAKSDRLVNDMGDHDVLIEKDIPLDAFIELRRET